MAVEFPGTAAASRSLTLLNVNDEPARRYLVTRAGRRAGFEVIEADTGAEAIRRARADAPDIVVLDVKLPDADGVEVCRQIKADLRPAAIPVILYSAYLTEDEDKLRGLAVADGYVAEPVTDSVLDATLRAILRARRAEQAARAAEAGERFFFEALPLPGWVFDRESLAILRVNEAAVKFFGYSREDLGSMSVYDLWPPEDREAVMAVLTSGNADTTGLWRLRTKEGVVRDFELFTRPLFFGDRDVRLVVASDVTDRQQAEEALKAAQRRLRRSQERLGRLVDSSMVGIAFGTLDRITEANDAFLAMIVRSREELEAGRIDWRAMTPPECLARDERALAELAERGECAPFEKEYVLQDGTRLPVLIGAALLEREPLEWVCFVIDITAAKRAEAAREAARREAEAANRAKDEFLALLSHELRTPLSSLIGWLKVLRSGTAPADRVPEILDRLDRATHVQMRLIEGLLDVSRIVSGKLEIVREPIDLAEVVRCAAEARRPDADAKQLHLAVELAAGPLPLLGDAVRLEQAIGNLIVNAVDFTPLGGRIEVRLERSRDLARITVTDTGEGIHRDLLPHVFERFRQGAASPTRRRQGLGLGLAIVRHVVEQHGGTVMAESAGPGLGTTLTVELPLPAPGR
jgi:PAS domain S-box-containing protein